MKYHRFAVTSLALGSCSVAQVATGFSVAPGNSIKKTALNHPLARTVSAAISRTSTSYVPSLTPWFGRRQSVTTSSSVSMIFDRLFASLSATGGGGGSGIVYENLDHPGPELANAAKAGTVLTVSTKDPNLHIATFAGGCFWGLELAYQRVPGVIYTAVGYCQGKEQEPTYNEVCSGGTGHTEAVIVYYDPKVCTYDDLLNTFFERVDPTTVNGQGNDFGKQYRTGVYPHTPEQMTIATNRFNLEKTKYNRPIATELKDATPFWPAEKYHQQYLEKGGRMGRPQSAEKGSTDPIRCYG